MSDRRHSLSSPSILSACAKAPNPQMRRLFDHLVCERGEGRSRPPPPPAPNSEHWATDSRFVSRLRAKPRPCIAALGGAAAWPVVARAQENAMRPVVAVLFPVSEDTARPNVTALRSADELIE